MTQTPLSNSFAIALNGANVKDSANPTGAGVLPDQVTGVAPANGATDQGLNTDVSWNAATEALTYDVYFGTSATPPFIGNQAGIIYDPGIMLESTTYYTRIDSVNASGTTAGITTSFATGLAAAGLIYFEDFESGTLNGNNGYRWSAKHNAQLVAGSEMSGVYSAEIEHIPGDPGTDPGDTWGEFEILTPNDYPMFAAGQETWMEMDVKIPSNWARAGDELQNSKFFYFYSALNTDPVRSSIGMEIWPPSAGTVDEVYVDLVLYNKGSALGHDHPYDSRWGKIVNNGTLITAADKGTIFNFKFYYKASDSGADNGHLIMKKNDVTLLEYTAIPDLSGTKQDLYGMWQILGYSNWGYDVNTKFHCDNFHLSSSAWRT